MPLTQALAEHHSIMKLADWVQKQGQVEDFLNFFVISKSLWERRNKKIYENIEIEPKQAIERAVSNQTLVLERNLTLTHKLSQAGRWEPPEKGTLKLNVDGASFEDL